MVGLNVRSPWSTFLINGLKTVETRSYHLPLKYVGVPLALIETPGKTGKFKSRIIGLITFNESFKYKSKDHWTYDYYRHKVGENNIYRWNDFKDKYGWVVSKVEKFCEPIDPPKRRGIIFTTGCNVFTAEYV
jgi:hypothetical protein